MKNSKRGLPLEKVKEVSSGGVIYRREGEVLQVALIARRTRKQDCVWCLPKGGVEEGESLEEAATREVREETGLHGKLLHKLGEIHYEYFSPVDRTRRDKTVHFFLFEYLSGSMEDHDEEAEEVCWFPIDEALRKITFVNERNLIQQAQEHLLKLS